MLWGFDLIIIMVVPLDMFAIRIKPNQCVVVNEDQSFLSNHDLGTALDPSAGLESIPSGARMLEEHVSREYTLEFLDRPYLCLASSSQNNLRIERFEAQSGAPRSIIKINARITMMFRTSEKPKPAPWLAQPRRCPVTLNCSVLSRLEDSRSLRYLQSAGTLLWHTSCEGIRSFLDEQADKLHVTIL